MEENGENEIINFDAIFRRENELYDVDIPEVNKIENPLFGFLKIQL